MTDPVDMPTVNLAIDDVIALSRTGPDGSEVELGRSAGLSTVAWFASTLLERDEPVPARLATELDTSVAGIGRVLFVPTDEGGVLLGLSYQTETAECLRGLHEGLAHAAAALVHEVDRSPTALTLSGSGASVSSWQQLVAAATGLPVSLREGDARHAVTAPEEVLRRHAELREVYATCRDALTAGAARQGGSA